MNYKDYEERFWRQIHPEPNSGCWFWIGHLNDKAGYGRVSFGNSFRKLAHVFSYELYRGPIPLGLAIHHRCGLPSCVNPDHLEPMTWAENSRLVRKNYFRSKVFFCVSTKGIGPGGGAEDMKVRIMRYVQKSGDCWVWTGAKCGKYGAFSYKKETLAHRISYILFKAEIPSGLDIDHLCRNTLCVNPAHLEPVTRAENHRRRAAVKTHCKRGHPFDVVNTWIEKNGARHCRRWHADREAAKKKLKKLNLQHQIF